MRNGRLTATSAHAAMPLIGAWRAKPRSMPARAAEQRADFREFAGRIDQRENDAEDHHHADELGEHDDFAGRTVPIPDE